jgi:phenylacetate-CoA ligase
MLAFLHRRVLIPAFESGLKRRKSFNYWRRLDASQWLPASELQVRQFEALRKLLVHAAAGCPYYRDSWNRAGLDPARLHSAADLQSWPIIDRDAIRANRSQMRSTTAGLRLIRKSTGGSSGVPLEFDIDEGSYEQKFGAWYRGYSWAGAAPGSRQWYLWGAPTESQSLPRRWKTRLYDALYRRRLANSFELSDARVPWFFEDLNRCRPDNIVAYTSPLYTLARAFDERGMQPWSPRSIVVGAEKLHAFQRTLIERVFRAPVYETYGSREFMLIGAECEKRDGLHLTQENLLVEIVDDDGRPTPDGKEGNVVITDLTNYGMPFIRYLNGDRAIAGFSKCLCGRGLPLLRKVVGRRLDVLETADGRHVPGEFFPHLMKDYPAVRRFQVVQESSQSIQVRLVVNGDWNSTARQSLEHQIRGITGDAVELRIDIVDDIPLTRAGKLQVVVRQPSQDADLASPIVS